MHIGALSVRNIEQARTIPRRNLIFRILPNSLNEVRSLFIKLQHLPNPITPVLRDLRVHLNQNPDDISLAISDKKFLRKSNL